MRRAKKMLFKGQYFNCVEADLGLGSEVTLKFKREKMWHILPLFMQQKGLWNYGDSRNPDMLRLFPAIGDVLAGETCAFYSHPHHHSYDTSPSTVLRWKGGGEEVFVTPDFDREFAEFAAKYQVVDVKDAHVVAPVSVPKQEVERWWLAQGKRKGYNNMDKIYNEKY